jgi:heme/copper-type cytochrome/quinol oxidase subunit 4
MGRDCSVPGKMFPDETRRDVMGVIWTIVVIVVVVAVVLWFLRRA